MSKPIKTVNVRTPTLSGRVIVVEDQVFKEELKTSVADLAQALRRVRRPTPQKPLP